MGDGLVGCPDCGAPMAERPQRCSACGLVLVGETAARLWAVDQRIAELTTERVALLRTLRAAGSIGIAAAVPDGGGGPAPALPSYPVPPHLLAGRPRVEWSRRRVQNLLLSLGVLLLAVAALIFIAVNWGTLGAGGRAGVMAGVTVSAAGAATVAARRELPATAESVAALTVALLIVDGVGLRLMGVGGGIALTTYAGAVSAVIAVVTAVWSVRVRIRALRVVALIAAELVLPLVTGTGVRPAEVAAVYGLQAVVLLVFRFRLAPDLLRITAYIWWGISLFAAVVATYGHAGLRSDWGPVELAAFTAIAVWAALHDATELHLALATATGIAALCGFVPHLDASWRAPAVEVAALLAALAVLLIPTRVAQASTAVVAAAGLGALLTAKKPIAEALAAPAGVTRDEIWHGAWPRIRSLRATDAIHTGQPWPGTAQLAVLALAALATAVVLGPKMPVTPVTPETLKTPKRAAARRAVVPTIAVLVVVNLILVPLEASWTLPAAVGWELVLGAVLLIAAMRKDSANARVPAIVGACFLVHAALWSLRSPVLTVVAVAVTLLATTAAALAARKRVRDRLVLVTAAAALLAVEAALIAGYQGASFAQIGVVLGMVAAAVMMTAYILGGRLDTVLATALQVVVLVVAATAIGFSAYEPVALAITTAVLIAATAPAIVLGREPLAPVWPALVQVLLCLETDTVHRWIAPDADLGSRALILALVAAAVSVAATAFRRLPEKAAAVALITGPSIYTLATIGTIAGRRFDPIWLGLLAGGVAAALIAALGAVRSARAAEDTTARDPRLAIHLPAAISSLLLVAGSWVRLAESHIHSVEPYTLPAAVILLGAGHLRRRHDPEAASWPCYGPGLVLGLTPTLLQALADPGLLRPALVGVAGLGVLAAGVRGRLQAPLAVGSAVLAIDAVAQLSPALAAAYDAVPRWTLIALAGALLLALGVGYERRIRDLRTLGRKFSGLR
ncbi:hypothetical protein ABIA31_002673 [Catenulispora sp. MAP5-51]